jgi:hypothetical protein
VDCRRHGAVNSPVGLPRLRRATTCLHHAAGMFRRCSRRGPGGRSTSDIWSSFEFGAVGKSFYSFSPNGTNITYCADIRRDSALAPLNRQVRHFANDAVCRAGNFPVVHLPSAGLEV